MAATLRDDRPETEAREDEHVVGLADVVAEAEPLDRLERGAGRDQRLAVGPLEDVGGRGLGGGGRVRERHDHRSGARLGHRADDGLGERAGHPGRPDEDLRTDPADRLEQVRRRAVHRGRGDFLLRGVQVVATGVDEPARVHGHDRLADDVVGDALVGEEHPQQPRDPGPGRAGADQHDPRVRGGAGPAPAAPR